jgi:ribonuclease HII
MHLSMARIAGIDEVGRGPLAGPVLAAAVVLHPDRRIDGLKDSKQLTAHQREYLAVEIRARAWGWALGRAEVDEVDDLNILRASLLAMERAVAALAEPPDAAVVDGLHAPRISCPVETRVAADRDVPAVSAASILAKVCRDLEMVSLDQVYPGYGFARHKGYPTPEHLASLRRLGPTPIHRRSFAPVRDWNRSEEGRG